MRRLIFLLLLACGDQDCTAQLSGHVSHRGYLLGEVLITARSDEHGDIETVTDAFGAYELSLPPGRWRIVVDGHCYVAREGLTLHECAEQVFDIETRYRCDIPL